MKTFYKNGKIFTSNPEALQAEAMLVDGEKIVWIGTMAEAPALSGEDAVVDLDGARVLPGIVDAHMHPVMLADCAKQITAMPPAIHSLRELSDEIARVAKETPEGQWIEGWGYDEGKYEEKSAPTREVLDRGCADRPVMILRACAHIRAVNSKVLEMAGIDRNTPDPVGGEIERDAFGEPTGILKENARNLVLHLVPEKKREDMIANLKDLGELLLSQGVTSICDMGSLDHINNYDLFGEAAKLGFKQKVAVYYMWDDYVNDESFTITEEQKDRSQQIFAAGLKMIGDGSVSGHTAWMNRPYKGCETDCGMPVYTDEQMEKAIEFCKKHHCQLSVHAMGAKAIERALTRVCKEEPWTKEGIPYVRMEHLTDPTEESMEMAIAHGISFSTQPIFQYAEIETYLENLGEDWTKQCYPVKAMLDKGVSLSFSSDAPATVWPTPSDPFPNMKGAVTRVAYDGTDCGAAQRVDAQTAVELYTREAAKIAGFEGIGELKAGNFADFIVLDRDILQIPGEEIDQVKVVKTFVNGECVYQRA